MPNLKVKFYGLITDVVNEPQSDLYIPDDATGRDFLQSLSDKYGPQFANRVLDHQGNLLGYVKIFINQVEINNLKEKLNIAEKEGAEAMVYVFSAVEGG